MSSVLCFFSERGGILLFFFDRLIQSNSASVHPLALVSPATSAAAQQRRTTTFEAGLSEFDGGSRIRYYRYRLDCLVQRFVYQRTVNDLYRLPNAVELRLGYGRIAIRINDGLWSQVTQTTRDEFRLVLSSSEPSNVYRARRRAVESVPWPIVPTSQPVVIRGFTDSDQHIIMGRFQHFNVDIYMLPRGQQCYILLQLLHAFY